MADDSKCVYNVDEVKDCKYILVGDNPSITIINNLVNTKDQSGSDNTEQESVDVQENPPSIQNFGKIVSIGKPAKNLDGGYSTPEGVIENCSDQSGSDNTEQESVDVENPPSIQNFRKLSIGKPAENLDGGYSTPEGVIENSYETETTEALVVALVNSHPGLTDSLTFQKGDVGRFIKEDNGRWLIELKGTRGWVPMEYWVQVKKDSSGSLLHGTEMLQRNQHQWFCGKMSRGKCEDLFGQFGENLDYIVRESVQRAGCYALSMMYNFKVYHFPIQKSSSGKLYTGQKGYDSLSEIVEHFSTHPLFFTDKGKPMSLDLGKPLKILQSHQTT